MRDVRPGDSAVVASLDTCSNRMPRFSVSFGETTQRSCTYAEVVVRLNSAPRCGIQRCTRDVPGTNMRNRMAVGVEHRRAGRQPEVGHEHVASRALRVGADARVDEVLDAALQLVAAETAARGEVAEARRQLAVVALFRVARVEVRRVVLILRAGARQERRVEDVGRRAADPSVAKVLLRVLRRQQHARVSAPL